MRAAAHPGWLYNGDSPQLNLTHLVHRRRRTRGAVCSLFVPTEPSWTSAERDTDTGWWGVWGGEYNSSVVRLPLTEIVSQLVQT